MSLQPRESGPPAAASGSSDLCDSLLRPEFPLGSFQSENTLSAWWRSGIAGVGRVKLEALHNKKAHYQLSYILCRVSTPQAYLH